MEEIFVVRRLYAACGFRAPYIGACRLVGVAPQAVCMDAFYSDGIAAIEDSLAHHNAIAHERKMWRARRMARIFSYLPFVRAIAVCNSLGFQTVHENSDIDIVVIARAGRVWSARSWVTGVLACARLRPGEARRDPVCASFFIDESVDDLSHLMIEHDVYFMYWKKTLLPLYGEHALFVEAAHTAPQFRVRAVSRAVRAAADFFGSFFSETWMRRQQEKILPRAMREAAERSDTCVVLTNTIIKLHLTDRRRELRDAVYGGAIVGTTYATTL